MLKISPTKCKYAVCRSLLTSLLACAPALSYAQDEKEPPRLLRGGLVQQLRSLSEDALDALNLTDNEKSDDVLQAQDRSDLRDPVSLSTRTFGRPEQPSIPPQPTGRATLQRTHKSPWLERIAEVTRPPWNDASSSAGGDEAPRSPRSSGNVARNNTSPGSNSTNRYNVSNVAPSSNSDPQFFQLSDRADAAEVVTPEQVLQGSGPAGVQGFVHVEKELPEDVLRSIRGTNYIANSRFDPPSEASENGTASQEARRDSQIFPRSGKAAEPTEQANQAPKVPRIPLPPGVAPVVPRKTAQQTPKPQPTANKPAPAKPESNQAIATSPSTGSSTGSSGAVMQLSRLPSPAQTNVAQPTSPLASRTASNSNRPVSPAAPQLPVGQSVSVPTALVAVPQSERNEPPLPGPSQTRSLPPPSVSQSDSSSSQSPVPPETRQTHSGNMGQVAKSPVETSAPAYPSSLPSTLGNMPAQPQPSLPGLAPTRNNPPSAPLSTVSPSFATNSMRSQNERLKMETPHVEVVLNGPSDMPVGTPAKYEIVVSNVDDIDLQGLILRLDVPAGVAVQALAPSTGEFEFEQASDGATLLTWGFEKLAPKQTATAPLQMTANSSKNFAVAMEWTLVPVSGSTDVEVRSPRLELALEGPSEVKYGQPNVYRLRIRNPGNAPASNVQVQLSAAHYGSSTSEIGSIAPGQEELVDVELTFHQRGTISITAAATEGSGLTSNTGVDVYVRQAELQAQLATPETVYHGTPSDLQVLLTNSGDAAAEELMASVTLPPGTELLSGPAGAATQGDRLTWTIPGMQPGATENIVLQLKLTQAGENEFQFQCTADSGPAVNLQATTVVEAVADLKLVVDDPVAPAPVGGEVVYELQLTNRGAKAATNVKVVAQFSEGIEPTRAEGHGFQLVPGQVFFEPIPVVAAGQEVVLRVFAKADAGGTHRFRAEIRSDESEVRLVQEESTQYLDVVRRTAASETQVFR